MPTPEEIAAAEAAKATPAVTETEPAAVVETPVVPDEPYDKDRAMATINTLREIEKQAKKDKKELERLQKIETDRQNAELTETERLQKENERLSAENAKTQSDLLRRDVIAETGLPATFADRLKGTTKEELLADAQELAKTLPQLKIAPKLPANNPSNASTVETDAQRRERLNPQPKNVFDLDAIREGGGGVVWNVPPEGGKK